MSIESESQEVHSLDTCRMIIFQKNLEIFEWLTDFMDCLSTNRFYPASNESDVYQKALSDDKDDNFLAGT